MRTTIAVVLSLASAVSGAAPLAAQSWQSCAARGLAPTDTARLAIGLSAPSDVRDTRQHRLLAQAVAEWFERPTSLDMPDWVGTWLTEWGSRDEVASDMFNGELTFRFGPDGRTGIRLTRPTDAAGLNAALVRAAHYADTGGAYLGIPGEKTREFALVIRSGSPLDTTITALMRIALPFLPLNAGAAPVRVPAPEYPARMQSGGQEGRVELRFVVDTDGRAIPASVEVIRASHPAFAASARKSILAATFRPARAGFCPAPQLVRQVINFKLERSIERLEYDPHGRPRIITEPETFP